MLFAILLVSACLTSAWKVNLPLPMSNGCTLSMSYAADLMALILLGPAPATLVAVQQHSQVGFRLHVLEPGKASTMYHRESDQEDFLVLSGECLLIVEGEERRLRPWDFFHCAPIRRTHSSAMTTVPA